MVVRKVDWLPVAVAMGRVRNIVLCGLNYVVAIMLKEYYPF